MIYKQFKTQPVQAFYKILVFAFVPLLIISVAVSAIYFLLVKVIILNSIEQSAIEQIAEIVKNQQQNPGDMVSQSKKMQEIILKYPQILPLIFTGMGLLLLCITYIITFIQKLVKDKIMGNEIQFLKCIIPDLKDLSILIYILLFLPVFTMVFSISIISIKANPAFSVISIFFLIIVILRSILLIPGIEIGEMKFGEALKYSFQMIKVGRALKIVIFGFLIFVLLSILTNFIFYFPMQIIKFDNSELYYNFLMILFQSGFVSVGLASLFTRYGVFEEETEINNN